MTKRVFTKGKLRVELDDSQKSFDIQKDAFVKQGYKPEGDNPEPKKLNKKDQAKLDKANEVLTEAVTALEAAEGDEAKAIAEEAVTTAKAAVVELTGD